MKPFTLTYRRPLDAAPVQLEFDHDTQDWGEVASVVSARQFPGVAVVTPLWLEVSLAKREKPA